MGLGIPAVTPSLEASQWEAARSHFSVGTSVGKVPGKPDGVCVPPKPPTVRWSLPQTVQSLKTTEAHLSMHLLIVQSVSTFMGTCCVPVPVEATLDPK